MQKQFSINKEKVKRHMFMKSRSKINCRLKSNSIHIRDRNLFDFLTDGKSQVPFTYLQSQERQFLLISILQTDSFHQSQNPKRQFNAASVSHGFAKHDKNQLKYWKLEVVQKIKQREDAKQVQEGARLLISSSGIPFGMRKHVWRSLIGNGLSISRPLFRIYFQKCVKQVEVDPKIKQRVGCTFRHFQKLKRYKKAMKEAQVLLQMFSYYRPDLGYVQGSSCVLLMLLMHFAPFQSFTLFCNLVLGRAELFKLFTMDTEFIDSVNKIVRSAIEDRAREIGQESVEAGIDVWSIWWLEMTYSLFLKFFEFKTCLILWDLFLLYGINFVVKLNLVVVLLGSREQVEPAGLKRMREFLYENRVEIVEEATKMAKQRMAGIDDQIE